MGAVARELDDYLDLRLRLPELLLMRIDKMSMGVSLEARVPFLDHRFVALALSIPTKAKVPGRRAEARAASVPCVASSPTS